MAEARSPFYITLDVEDRPGVLGTVAAMFGDHGVSIRSMEQEGLGHGARIIFLTHAAREGDVQATLDDLATLPVVRSIGGVLRIIGEDDR